jgi:hypothetical protein
MFERGFSKELKCRLLQRLAQGRRGGGEEGGWGGMVSIMGIEL